MFKKRITMHTLALLLMAGGITFSQASCSRQDRAEVSQGSDQAYNDFKNFVTESEAKAQAASNQAEADYERETTQMKADYDAKVAAVDQYADQYDEARRQEIEQLRTRYTTAYDQRDQAWRNKTNTASGTDATTGVASGAGTMKVGKYYKPTSPAAQLTAANARQTYENFTQMIKQNEDRYDIDDWRNINAEWRALDEAYDAVKGDISANDLAAIQKEKLKYAAFKSVDKTQARAAQGANAVSDEAKEVKDETADERSKVGQAVSNTASDVKETGKDVGKGAAKVGKKVGTAVKGAYKEVKSEVKNTDND
ncbi:hypothetical protein GCM10011375_19470 [Hymenobacter qilianensis]|uniref:Uncharacterized protein n=2 Tax=Hymenobacter qilianensis TaxID=1385715 RepID=A0ACB5PRB9_9BACT|nr:hypothetical protein [Hymenobacter qilianensis]QNP52123.1 hypothetical protein H9L05_19920 [Hymenobacter qilianensis]GGF64643.1 hypothetical protein GCM10011375_19470 [Hymenobacter qilianensis]